LKTAIRKEGKRITETRKNGSPEKKKRIADNRCSFWSGDGMAPLFEAITHRIIKAAIDVHRELGPGFIESVYHRAMEVALQEAGLSYETEKEVSIHFAGVNVGCHRLNLVVEREIIVELKAVKAFEDIFFAKLKSYLKATGLHLGLLMNFNATTLVVKRVIL